MKRWKALYIEAHTDFKVSSSSKVDCRESYSSGCIPPEWIHDFDVQFGEGEAQMRHKAEVAWSRWMPDLCPF